MSRMSDSPFTVFDVVVTVIWAIALPIAAIWAYGHGLPTLGALLTLCALGLAWLDVIERNVSSPR